MSATGSRWVVTNAVVHACTVGSDVVIEDDVIVLDGARVEDGVLIEAGATVFSPGASRRRLRLCGEPG